jgi:uncharacterized protein DUF4242
MPRYVVERSFAGSLELRADTAACGDVVRRNGDEGVTWLHSYVSDDGTRTFCVYEGPSPEAIRKAAAVNKLPVDRITQVRVLDPYFL